MQVVKKPVVFQVLIFTLALSACFFTDKVDAQANASAPPPQTASPASPSPTVSPLSPAARAPDAALPSLAPLVDSVKTAVVNVDVQAKAPSGEVEFGPGSD